MILFAFLEQLKTRNASLFYFGVICVVLAGLSLALTWLTDTQVFNVNAWFKPFKFAVSTWLFVWAMAWYCAYLPSFNVQLYSWTVITLLTFELGYITLQASKGQLSHFNISTPVYAGLYSTMAIAITIVTLYTGYVGFLFFQHDVVELPQAYLWGIRFGIMIFVIFAFEGFVMGSRLTHTIGGPDGSTGLPVVGWSTKFGDPRIAHFVGMHALQILPLLAWYIVRSTRGVITLSVLYGMLAVFTLVQALQGKPLWRSTTDHTVQHSVAQQTAVK